MSNLISLFDELPSEPVSCSPTLIIFSLDILQGKVVDITGQEGTSLGKFVMRSIPAGEKKRPDISRQTGCGGRNL